MNETEKNREQPELLRELEELRKQVRFQNELLESVKSNAIAVYELNLTRGTVEQDIVIETVHGPWNLMEDLGLRAPCSFEDVFQPMIERNISPEFHYWCGQNFSRSFMLEYYESGHRESAFEYRRLVGCKGPRFVRHCMHYAHDPDSGDLIVRATVKDVTNRYRMQGVVPEQETTHSAMLTYLNELYFLTYYIDIPGRSYIPLTTNDEIRGKLLGYIDTQEALQCLSRHYALEKYHAELLEFNTLNTLSDRLKAQKYVTMEFETRNLGWVRASFITAEKDDFGNVVAVLYTLQNINADKEKQLEIQRQLKEALRKADSANKAKSTFLFNMSHDIRTPMNAILGFADLALRHISDRSRVEEDLKKIRISGSHLLSLINDILEMSRIESGKLEIASKPMELRRIVSGVDQMCRTLAAASRVNYSTTVGRLDHPYVFSDELHINEVIINLISNAVKYTGAGGTVNYTFEQTTAPENGTAWYRCTVKDNGIGMTEEFQSRLFEHFTREDSEDVNKTEGAGLGLAIVKRIVELAGGTISVESRKGVGSTFTVDLPLKVMTEQEILEFMQKKQQETVRTEKTGLRGKRILLVEDNDINREIAEEILTDAGMDVEGAVNGAEAVQMVEEKGTDYYDAVLMDIQMPVMNGFEATGAIRKIPGAEHLPVIALSANAFREDVERSLRSGMNDHISKPINIRELMSVLEQYIGKEG